jgi:hypothetical protein
MRPANDKFMETVEGMRKQIDQLERVPQLPQSGWQRLAAEQFSKVLGVQDDWISRISGGGNNNPIGQGSKLWFVKGGVDYFGWCIFRDPSSSTRYVVFPSATGLPSGPYDEVYVSNSATSEEFPGAVLLEGLEVTLVTGSGSITNFASMDCNLSVNNNLIKLSYTGLFTTGASSNITKIGLENPLLAAAYSSPWTFKRMSRYTGLSFNNGTNNFFSTREPRTISTQSTVQLESIFTAYYWGHTGADVNDVSYDIEFYIY